MVNLYIKYSNVESPKNKGLFDNISTLKIDFKIKIRISTSIRADPLLKPDPTYR